MTMYRYRSYCLFSIRSRATGQVGARSPWSSSMRSGDHRTRSWSPTSQPHTLGDHVCRRSSGEFLVICLGLDLSAIQIIFVLKIYSGGHCDEL